jgi:hypothetical protein
MTRTRAGFLADLLLPAATAGAIEVGQLAPDFTRQDINGMSHTLSALRGKAVLLAFVGRPSRRSTRTSCRAATSQRSRPSAGTAFRIHPVGKPGVSMDLRFLRSRVFRALALRRATRPIISARGVAGRS